MKPVLRLSLRKLLPLALFLIILFYFNSKNIQDPFYLEILNLINSTVWIIVGYTLIFYFAELFNILDYPYNLPAPLFNAFGAYLLVKFASLIFIFYYPSLESFKTLIYVIIIMIVIASGYVKILKNAGIIFKK